MYIYIYYIHISNLVQGYKSDEEKESHRGS